MNAYSPLLVYSWIISVIFLLLGYLQNIKNQFRKKITKETLITIIIVMIPSLVRIANMDPHRFHGDDLITAYFSATEKFSQINFFSGIPSRATDWVTQFPNTFFMLQKIFFFLFGESLLSVKLSIIPYVIIVSVFLYLIVKTICNRLSGYIAVLLYAFFPISLYFETLGLHFISSTAAFMIFFYLIILHLQKKKEIYAILIGISAGLCFLFYTTSYIALPLMIVFFAIQLIRERKLQILYHLLIAIFSLLIFLGPFITYAFTADNYFTSRMSQVSLLSGTWSVEREKPPFEALGQNFLLSLQSMYENGPGGQGGYLFAHLALFNRYSLILFIIGAIIAWSLILSKIEILYIFLAIIASFMTMVLAIPPPAYQRFALSFPFLVIIACFPFYAILKTKLSVYFKFLFIALFIVLYSINSQFYFMDSVEDEREPMDYKVAEYIYYKFPNRNVHIAAFPGFAPEKWYRFLPKHPKIQFVADYHLNLVKSFNPDEKYVYIILYPESYTDMFTQKDTRGEIIPFLPNYNLFAN